MPDTDDIFGPDDDDTVDEAPAAPPAPEAEAAPAAPAPAAPAAPQVDEQQQALLAAALGTLKSAWATEAKAAGYAAAEFDGIGLKGFDDGAKQAFLAEAKASHEATVKRLESLGFRYDPEHSAAEAQAQREAAEDAAAKAQWGPTGPSAAATEGEVADKAVQEAVKAGDTISVIKGLKGLGDFMVRRA